MKTNKQDLCYECKKDLSMSDKPQSGCILFKWDYVLDPLSNKYYMKTDHESVKLFCSECFKLIAPEEYQ